MELLAAEEISIETGGAEGYNVWPGGIVSTQMVVPASHTQPAPQAPQDLRAN